MKIKHFKWWMLGLVGCLLFGYFTCIYFSSCEICENRKHLSYDNEFQKEMHNLLYNYFIGLGISHGTFALFIDNNGLYHLRFGDSNLSDLNILKGMPLIELDISCTKVIDLTPLSRFKTLRELGLIRTKVSDLSPIQNLPLDILLIGGTDVRDLSPITNMPLRVLHIVDTVITNLDVIFQTDINYLDFDLNDFSKEQIEKLRNSKIEIFNGYKHERFWREYDEGLW